MMGQRPLKHSMLSSLTAPSTISGQRLISSPISKEHYRRKPTKSYGTTDSFKELVKTLKGRFGGANQSDKFRTEIRNRRRKDGESLQSLHSDVRRLAALAFPDLQHSARETIACDYFIDALADADFALKVRERAPTNLDSAFRTALQLEVWSKRVDRTTQYKKIREVTKTDDKTTVLKKQVADLQKQLAKLSQQMPKTTPVSYTHLTLPTIYSV